jgi:hypothetical protein
MSENPELDPYPVQPYPDVAGLAITVFDLESIAGYRICPVQFGDGLLAGSTGPNPPFRPVLSSPALASPGSAMPQRQNEVVWIL